jgi:hypothetical protein
MRAIKKLTFSVLTFCILFLAGCDTKTPPLLEAVEKATESVRAGRVASAEIDVQPFFKSKVSKLCVQYPYQEKKGFERSSGHKLETYDAISDDKFMLWIFFSDKSIKPELIPLPKYKPNVANRSARCSEKLLIFIEWEDQIASLLIKE